LAAVAACSGDSNPGPVEPPIPQPPSAALEGDVLFIGNSLTEDDDVPGIVASLADSAGTPGFRTAALTRGGGALEDHWVEASRFRSSLRATGASSCCSSRSSRTSLEGSYLAALVIYGGLSGRSPIGLPAAVRAAGRRHAGGACRDGVLQQVAVALAAP
jgi:hypothetical protein